MTALPGWTDLPDGLTAELDPAERNLAVCYPLDPTTGTYASARVHPGKMTVADPFSVAIDLTTLL